MNGYIWSFIVSYKIILKRETSTTLEKVTILYDKQKGKYNQIRHHWHFLKIVKRYIFSVKYYILISGREHVFNKENVQGFYRGNL